LSRTRQSSPTLSAYLAVEGGSYFSLSALCGDAEASLKDSTSHGLPFFACYLPVHPPYGTSSPPGTVGRGVAEPLAARQAWSAILERHRVPNLSVACRLFPRAVSFLFLSPSLRPDGLTPMIRPPGRANAAGTRLLPPPSLFDLSLLFLTFLFLRNRRPAFNHFCRRGLSFLLVSLFKSLCRSSDPHPGRRPLRPRSSVPLEDRFVTPFSDLFFRLLVSLLCRLLPPSTRSLFT